MVYDTEIGKPKWRKISKQASLPKQTAPRVLTGCQKKTENLQHIGQQTFIGHRPMSLQVPKHRSDEHSHRCKNAEHTKCTNHKTQTRACWHTPPLSRGRRASGRRWARPDHPPTLPACLRTPASASPRSRCRPGTAPPSPPPKRNVGMALLAVNNFDSEIGTVFVEFDTKIAVEVTKYTT